jgi:broad specificity phosphatase PhoE
MQFYLIRHGQSDGSLTVDPYSPPLTATGRKQASHLAEQCAAWGVQFLVASTMRRAQETADAIATASPTAERWDLSELEDLTLEDLNYDPGASHLVSTWTEAQRAYAFERAWVRVMAALARVEIYARANALSRVAIVAHGSTLALLLLNWLGADWTARSSLRLDTANGSTTLVEVADDGGVAIGWLNRV